jgi:hypothetical protein
MRYYMIIVFGWCLVSPTDAETLQTKTCTQEEAMQAEAEASTLKNWDAVYRSFKKFGHCDDGAIGEGYSEVVGRLLARDWKHFNRLITLASSDAHFERFVIRHVDETVPADKLEQIIENTSASCPSRAKRLCAQIRTAAR